VRKLRHFPNGGFQPIPVERRSRNGNVRRFFKQARRINLQYMAPGGCLPRKLGLYLRPDFHHDGHKADGHKATLSPPPKGVK
jgi:hypothetical protein